MKRDPNKYPKHWNRKRIKDVIAHYDSQSQDEAIAEADAAFENSRMTLVRVPNELVDDVHQFILSRNRKRKTA